MIWRARLGMLCFLALGVQSCASGDEREHFGQVRFETEHFRYYALDGTTPCENTGYWLERFYSSISDYLEVPRSRSNKIDYEWVGLDHADLTSQVCGGPAAACAQGDNRITSTRAFEAHEMTHVIAARFGQGLSFFAEGLAEMLYCGHGQIYDWLDKTQLDGSLITTDFGSLDVFPSIAARAVARSVVYYLTHHFDKRRFFQFYASIGPGSNLATIKSRFFEAFHVEFDDVMAKWQTIPERQDEACQYLVECEGEPAAGSVEFQTACGMEWLPKSSDTFVPFDVGASGRILIEDDNASSTQGMFNVYSCEGGAAGLAVLGGSQARYLISRPGRHFVWISTEEDSASGTLTFRDAPPATDACSPNRDTIVLPRNRKLVISRRWQSSTCSGFPWCPGESIDFIAPNGGILGVDPFWGSDLPITSPKSVYRCDTACPDDPAISCQSDTLVFGRHPGDVFNVQSSSISVGEIVHVAAGPINSADDAFLIGYSLQDE